MGAYLKVCRSFFACTTANQRRSMAHDSPPSSLQFCRNSNGARSDPNADSCCGRTAKGSASPLSFFRTVRVLKIIKRGSGILEQPSFNFQYCTSEREEAQRRRGMRGLAPLSFILYAFPFPVQCGRARDTGYHLNYLNLNLK